MIVGKVKLDERILGTPPELFETPRMIRLSKAILCLDCDTIFMKKDEKIGSAKVYCPNCGSKTNAYIAKFLNRTE